MPLIDPFNRHIKYIRVSVTDMCDLRCKYCSPKKPSHQRDKHSEYLSSEELARICYAFSNLGVKHVRFTGGEPLIRKDLSELIHLVNSQSKGLDISLSTNATRLERFASKLYDAGVGRLNISLDSLNAEKFNRITRGGDLNQVLRGISAAQKVGFDPIKINTVVMRGVNDEEIENLVDWAIQHGLEIRFIEIMPIGQSGIDSMKQHVPAQEIIDRIEKHLGSALVPSITKRGSGPARYYKTRDKHLGIGIISAVSRHFCETCNRVRITANGRLALCLGQEDSVDLRQPLRDGVSNSELENIIIDAIKLKPERHFFKENQHNIQFRQMVSLGG